MNSNLIESISLLAKENESSEHDDDRAAASVLYTLCASLQLGIAPRLSRVTAEWSKQVLNELKQEEEN